MSVRLPLTEQQDVRRLDVFDCFEEEPLADPNGQTSELVGGSTAKGGGWKETQRVEAGTVELEVSWKLNHKPETLSQQDVLPDPPALWELWLPLPQAEGQLCVLHSNGQGCRRPSLCTHLTSSCDSIVCKNPLV